MYPAPEPTTFERTDGRLTVRGDLDRATRHAFWEAVERLLQPGASAVVDLSGVSFIDAAGLTALLRAQRTAERAGVTLVLEAPSAAVVRLLARIHATELFVIRH